MVIFDTPVMPVVPIYRIVICPRNKISGVLHKHCWCNWNAFNRSERYPDLTVLHLQMIEVIKFERNIVFKGDLVVYLNIL